MCALGPGERRAGRQCHLRDRSLAISLDLHGSPMGEEVAGQTVHSSLGDGDSGERLCGGH